MIESAPLAEQERDRMSDCDFEKSEVGAEDSDHKDGKFDGWYWTYFLQLNIASFDNSEITFSEVSRI